MKKAITLILALLLMLTVVACSGSDNGSGGSGSADKEEAAATEGSAAKTLADETTAVSLSFTPPEGYDTVNCHIEKKADGTIVDKSLTYTFADESEVDIGYTKGKQITDAIPQSYLDKAESAEYAGKPFSIITEGKTIMAVCQDGDVIYGVGYSFAENQASGLASLSYSFSLIFLIIAALVIYASVGRMVQEQRALVGTSKALGLFNREILGKYMIFGVSAGVAAAALAIVMCRWCARRLDALFFSAFEFAQADH